MTDERTAEEVEATLRIGELADRSSMSLRTLRHYDEVGLLRPSGRTVGGFRLYTERDVDRLLLIRRMKPLGFSLDAMAELLRVADSLESAATPEEALAALTLRYVPYDAAASMAVAEPTTGELIRLREDVVARLDRTYGRKSEDQA